MIEKPKRPKKIPNQDNKQPQTIQELIRRYDLDNTQIYDFLDELVNSLNQEQTNVETLKNENGTAIKFMDGTMICTGEVSVSELVGNFSDLLPLYRTMTIEFNDFPVAFVGDIPKITFDVVSCSEPCWTCKWNNTEMDTTLTKPSRVSVIKITDATFTGIISYTAIGRWK